MAMTPELMMMKIRRVARLAVLLILTLNILPMTAQDKLFTLEDLNFGGTNYRKMQPQNMWLTWWGEQLMYQDAEEGGSVDCNGQRKTLFQLSDIGEEWHSAINATYPYPDQPLVRLENGKERILYDFQNKKVVWRQERSKQSSADWSPKSKAVAYVQEHQLYVMDAEGKVAKLSEDGSREIVYGQSVHRNEFGIEKGTFWSPDGLRLAFYRMDQSMVTDYPQVDIFPREASYEPDKYPMAGMTSHKVTVGVYDLKTSKTIYLQAGDPTDRYFTNIAWSPDAKTIYMFELNRKQNDCRLVSYNAETGEKISELFHETSDKYVEPLHPIQFLPWDDTKFIMQSQKDGYNHLYLFNIEGKELKQLTKGPWVVIDVVGFNKKSQSIIIVSNEKDLLQRNIYAVSVKTGKRTPLDQGIGCVQDAKLSASGQQIYYKYSAPEISRIICPSRGKSRTSRQHQ